MTKFILYVATSIDGYIARSDGCIDWLVPPPEEANQDESYLTFYKSIDALVMGSTTYKQVLGFGDWPYSGKLSYVLTRRNLTTTRSDVMFANNIKAILENTKQQGFQRVWLMGGGEVASLFIFSFKRRPTATLLG